MREKPTEIFSANQRLHNIYQAEEHIRIYVDIYFLSEGYWENEVLNWIENEDDPELDNPDYVRYVQEDCRAFEIDGIIYIKRSAKEDVDFRRLLLHELGHAVCDYYHTPRKGDIMNSNYREWYGDWSWTEGRAPPV